MSFNKSRVEVVLTDQQGKLIPQTRLTIGRATSIEGYVSISRFRRGIRRSGRTEFFYRALSNAIRLAQSTIDGSGFRNKQFGSVTTQCVRHVRPGRKRWSRSDQDAAMC